MLPNPFSLDARRRRLLKKAPAGPLKDFLSVPFPAPRTPVRQVPILALDFETTGLDPEGDHLLSVGHVEIVSGRVELVTACHRIVRSPHPLDGGNVAIHQLTDDQIAAGLPLEQVMDELLRKLAGKVLLAHNARIETGFLRAICRRLYGLAPVFPVIDTLALARRRLEATGQPIQGNELRLFNLRAARNLPRYRAHDALCDAIATAELFIVQVGNRAGRRVPPLQNFLTGH